MHEAQVDPLRRARWVLAAVLAANSVVAIAKIWVGLTSGSAAVRADGFHSLIDAGANVFGLVALSYSLHPPDQRHAYGHRKVESFASLGIVALLAVLVVEIVRDAIVRLQVGTELEVSAAVFIVMAVTLAVNAAVALLERRAGQALGSDFLLADSRQTFADIFVSLGVLLGVGLAAAGVPFADAGASLAVAVAVTVIGWQIVRRGAGVLLDQTVIPRDRIDAIMRSMRGVRSWHRVRTRGRPDEVFMDLHIRVESAISVQRGHGIAHEVAAAIRGCFPEVADVTVHVEPTEDPAGQGQDGPMSLWPAPAGGRTERNACPQGSEPEDGITPAGGSGP